MSIWHVFFYKYSRSWYTVLDIQFKFAVYLVRKSGSNFKNGRAHTKISKSWGAKLWKKLKSLL